MFGYLQASCLGAEYRRLYARSCQTLWQHEGRWTALLNSYESIFLQAIAVDIGLYERPEDLAPTCCRLYKKCRNKRNATSLVVEDFSRSFALLLAEIKLRDDVADENSLLARVALRGLRSAIRRAYEYFGCIDPQFEDRIQAILSSHASTEANVDSSLKQYQAATRSGFSYLFDLFARKLQLDESRSESLHEIGGHVGASIIAFDCGVDWERDLRLKQANPVRNRQAACQALLLAQQELSAAGWRCSELASPDALSVQILRHRLQTLTRRKLELQGSVESGQLASKAEQRSWHLSRRGGFCDGCDCGGCDCDCSGCGSAGGGCDNGGCDCCNCCCSSRGTNSGCVADPCVCGDCDDRRRSKKSTPDSSGTAESGEATRGQNYLVGKLGVAQGPLQPSGIVLIEGQEYAARSQHGYIDDNSSVRVVEVNAFGLVVAAV